MKRSVLLVALACALPAWSWGQAAADCPEPSTLTHRNLLGLWRASFDGLPQGATLLLEQHPELSESVTGAIQRGDEKALLAGDIDEGELALEESVDGTHISATWNGIFVDGSCGREIRGDWQGANDAAPRAFVLRKLP